MLKNLFFWMTVGIISITNCNISAQTLSLDWVNRYNGQGDSTSKYVCATIASDGNILMGGYTIVATNKRDGLVTKITPTGTLLWSYTLNGAGDGDDEVIAITSDASGNVYFAAQVDNDTTGDDICTFKLNSGGILGWVANYQPTVNQDDAPVSIALDASGNVFVGGFTDTNISPTADNLDYTIIKYDANGTQQWAKLLNGVANGDDKAVKMVLDGAGNPIIVGISDNGNDDDYLLAKYDNAGTLLWKRVLDNGDNDRATDLTTDASNNVYVTGRSKSADYDYYTVKYNAAGTLQWDNTFDDGNDDRATHISVDNTGNVFVAGKSFNTVQDYNVVVEKISSAGITLWTTTPYNYSTNKADEPFGMQLDASGNIYVGVNSVKAITTTTTTRQFSIIKYSGSPAQLWIQSYNPNTNSSEGGVLVYKSSSNEIYAGGFTESSNAQRSALALGYDNAGTFKMQNLFAHEGEYSDNVRKIVRDGSGNVYWAGYVTMKGQYRNFSVGKVSPTGTTLWIKTLDGNSSSDDEAVGVAIDPSGNILAGGTIKNPSSSSSYDYFIAKLNPSTGDTIFTKKYDYSTHRADKAVAFAADANGNFYLTGRTNNSTTITDNNDWLTVKWNNNGVFQWASTHSSTGNEDDRPNCLAVSNTGEVYVGGYVNEIAGNPAHTSLTLVKYSAAGVGQWTNTVTSLTASKKEVTDLYFNASNNHIYYTGTILGNTTNLDVVTSEVDAAGTAVWTTNLANISNDEANKLAVDKNGNTYIVATTVVGTSKNVVLAKYNNTGAQQWTQTYDSNASLNDWSDDIKVDNSANIYVAGHSEVISGGQSDIFTAVYNTNGIQQVVKTYDGTGNGDDVAASLILDEASNSVYVGGGSFGAANAQRDAVVIKYTYTPSVAIENQANTISHLLYPNPIQNKVIVEFSENAENYEVKWFNALGQNLALSYETNNQQIAFNTQHLIQGLYFYQIWKNGVCVGNGKVCK